MNGVFNRICWVFICFISITHVAYASNFLPEASSYNIKNYNAGHQNWACAQGSDGIMYFGNNKGLLVYDGFSWDLFPVPGNYIVRSLYVEGNRVYVGSFEEFGYFLREPTGRMTYHSLSSALKKFPSPNDEIWRIMRMGKKIIFQSFSTCYIYDGKHVSYIYNQRLHPLYFHYLYGRMYSQMIGNGVYGFDGKNYYPFLDRKAVMNDDVVAMLPSGNGSMVLLTVDNGLFGFKNGKVTQIHTDVDAELKRAKGNRAILMNDSTMAVGTLLDGIFIINKNGHCVWHFNRNNLLKNNSILGLCCDNEGNLWAALDDGISYIRTNSSITLLEPSVNDVEIGMVYDVERFGNALLMATNQGVYQYNFINGFFKSIPNTHGQNWYVKKIDNQVFIGNNAATLELNGSGIHAIPNTHNSTCIKHCTINGQEILLESSYDELRIYKKVGGRWKLSNAIQGFQAPIKNFEVDETGTIWLSHMYHGLYRITLSNDLKTVKQLKVFYSLSGNLKKTGQIHVMKVRGHVVFSNDDGFYVYSDVYQKMIPYNQLNRAVPYLKNACSAADMQQIGQLWIDNSHEYDLLNYENNIFKVKRRIPVAMFESPCVEGNNAISVSGGDAYFNLNNSVACYHHDKNEKVASLSKHLYIRSIIASSSSGEGIWLNLSNDGVIGSNYRDVSIRLSYPYYDCSPLRFVFQLKRGSNNLYKESSVPFVHYGSLEYGNYELEAAVYSDNGLLLGKTSYEFTIRRPILISYPAMMLYALCIIAGVYFISEWREKRAMEIKRKEYEEQQIKQDIKFNEQQRLIAEQEKKILETELSAKGKELASMALGSLAKHEALENLRTTVQEQLLKTQCGRRNMELVLKHINDNIDDEESWKLFQQNFDLIHHKFFRILRERYPQLTSTDLRFCALLRLNLSTKDIAQMTNLTVRGVETARYRLRKRIDIPDGVNLVDFLIDLK